jgi:acyl CoA:acetate/3-ketoacid CoA transferase beta subunit
MDVTEHDLVLRELAEGVTVDDIRAATEPPLHRRPHLTQVPPGVTVLSPGCLGAITQAA